MTPSLTTHRTAPAVWSGSRSPARRSIHTGCARSVEQRFSAAPRSPHNKTQKQRAYRCSPIDRSPHNWGAHVGCLGDSDEASMTARLHKLPGSPAHIEGNTQMKKRWSAIATLAIVLASVFAAQPANAATGSWQPYPGSIPSNWTCGASAHGPELSVQTCIVRSGYYVQSATIVRNRAPYQVIATVDQVTWTSNQYPLASGTCAPSGVGANSVSVCFTATVQAEAPVQSDAHVTANGRPTLFVYSPYA